eukprot:653675-Lingulodinium_polyedra.AAC.1
MFFGNLYEDDKPWVDTKNAALSATFDTAKRQPIQQQANRRAVGRYCVFCIGEFHKRNYMGANNAPLASFVAKAKESKGWIKSRR